MPHQTPYFRPRTPKLARTEAEAERHRFYVSARWVKLRAAFLASNPLCEACEAEGRLTPATVADHRLERLARPDLALDASNLRALCGSCHTRMHKTRARGGSHAQA